jgi:hypothetical protein
MIFSWFYSHSVLKFYVEYDFNIYFNIQNIFDLNIKFFLIKIILDIDNK